jgi:AP-1 complex subunit beta-1
MNDEDAYVRKTAALCVAKVYEIDPKRVETNGLLNKLIELIHDGNGMVVSNAAIAISEIATTKGLWFQPSPKIVHDLLNAVSETSDWGRINILDFLGERIPHELWTDEHIQRVIPHMAHTNPAVVMSAIKIILQYL